MPPPRAAFTPADTVRHIWTSLSLPPSALPSLSLTGNTLEHPSSFKIADFAQSSIGLSALTAALIHSHRNNTPTPPNVTIPRQHAAIEFLSEKLYTLNNKTVPAVWGPIGGLHKTADGYVRVHDNFQHHRDGARKLVGCEIDGDRDAFGACIATKKAVELEEAAFRSGLVIAALRSYDEWDALPHASAVSDFPIQLRKIGDAPAGLPAEMGPGNAKCLEGLRVLELSRVIAAPCAGRTLAAHGADVLWVTSPKLPDLPSLDRDLGRGKRTVHVDLDAEDGKAELWGLLEGAHVFIQGYRPSSLAERGFSSSALAERFSDRGIVCANMSAYGPNGPWSQNRGFDSLVQTCSGLNVSEAEHFGSGDAKAMPCQALDHAAGYFLAAGVQAALYRKAVEGGSWKVDVSLAGVMKYLRSLGQYEERSGFETSGYNDLTDVPGEYLETRETGFGVMTGVRHSAAIEGVQIGWDVMPKPLGSDEKKWL